MNHELLTYGRSNVSLANALDILPLLATRPGEMVALAYTPDRCLFAECQATTLIDYQQQPISLNSVFDCRVFNAEYELRWHHDRDGRGRAVLLGTQPLESVHDEWSELLRRPYLDEPRQNKYLLWGKSADEQLRAGWTTLYSTRTGDLNVPIDNPEGRAFIQLQTLEYFGVVDGYGNVRLIEERLAGLKPYHPA